MSRTDDPTTPLVAFAYEVGHLKYLPRGGWLRAGIRNPESVAEHSFRVAIIAFLIAVQEGADAEHAAVLGLFHDFPEARTGDVTPVGKKYVTAADPREVIADQTARLPSALAEHIKSLVAEHEGAKQAGATLAARCSRDADKLDCLLQAREYQLAGHQGMQPWIDSMIAAVATPTGKALAVAAQEISPAAWWSEYAAPYGRAPGEDES